MSQKLAQILTEVANLLLCCEEGEKATWLWRRRDRYLHATSQQEKQEVLNELRSIMAGMGSLSDLYLVPGHGRKLTEQQVNSRLRKLIKELDIAIVTERTP